MRKTKQGAQHSTLDDIISAIDHEHWFYYRGRATHPRVVGNFGLIFLREELARGVIFAAVDASDPNGNRPYVSKRDPTL